MSDLDSRAIALERSQLHFSLPLCETTWVARITRACSILEDEPSLPRDALSLTVKDDAFEIKSDSFECVADRAAYLRRLLDDPQRRLALANSAAQSEDDASAAKAIRVTGVMSDASRQAYDLTVELPAVPWAVREKLLAAIGDALEAYAGEITPVPAAQAFTAHYLLGAANADDLDKQRADWEKNTRMLRACMKHRSSAVPRIRSVDAGGARESPLQPAILGWINYWSADTCAYLGFPEAARDIDLLKHATQTPQGSWVVKLCDEPLDVSLEDHVEIVASVYSRFPQLGIRA